MAFEPEKILREHVFQAVEYIEKNNVALFPSSAYDAIIDGNPYPPKEIVKISYEIATGIRPGHIYSGQLANEILASLGFEIQQKVKVWKLGCHWERGNPSFYDFIKSESIVIAVTGSFYHKNDLVLITEGFTVYAVAQIKSEPLPITGFEQYQTVESKYQIPFEDWVLIAQAEWYELPKTEIFTYQLQSGIRQVRKKEIKDRAIDLWENKDYTGADIFFYSADSIRKINAKWDYPSLVLIKNNWNDDIYRTAFDLYYFKSYEERIEMGVVKILNRDHNDTKLPEAFSELSEEFCSLGQTLKYYQRLFEQFPERIFVILKRLNDAAFNAEYKRRFETLDAFKISLISSSEAVLALNDARSIVRNTLGNKQYSFTFSYQVATAVLPHVIPFDFFNDINLKNRLFCIIGKNGTGKTKVIAQLANKLVDIDEEGEFSPSRPTFSKVIAASFSYFDKFRFPRAKDISYEFIGIKDKQGLTNESKTAQILWDAYKHLSIYREKKELWKDCISEALETDYLDFDIDELDGLSSRQDFIDRTEDIFSSGQKIIFQFLTRFISIVEINSLLIFDEPETHLHPNIAGRLLRTIQKILNYYQSFAILATHSPIIVQEIPSKYIRIFDRQGKVPIIFRPVIECFGENLSIISEAIFQTDEEKEIYKLTLNELAADRSIEEINSLFDDKLSLNSRLYIQSIKR